MKGQLYEKFVKLVSFPAIASRSGLRSLYSNVKILNESQWWKPDALRELQLRRLKSMLIHAQKNTDYYRQRFAEHAIEPEKLHDIEDLSRLPPIGKVDIRDNAHLMLAKNISSNEMHASETGGTTGVKMRFYRDNACLSMKQAALYRYASWAGWDFGQRGGLVWPATADYVGHHSIKAKLKNALYERQVVFPAAILNDDEINSYVSLLRRKRPSIITAFPSPLCEVAAVMRRQGTSIALRGVITTGEPLYGHQRRLLQAVFKCGIFDSYRTREAGPIAQECAEHHGLHINAECLLVETVGTDSKAGEGEIVVTDLLNRGMPLIRYRIGDYGKLRLSPCPCGRGLPLLEGIQGRAADVFVRPDGRKIMPVSLVLYLIDEAPGMLGQVQIIQDRMDHLLIRVTPDPPLSAAIKDYHRTKVRELFGAEISIDYEVVPVIAREPSGKYRSAVSRLSGGGQC